MSLLTPLFKLILLVIQIPFLSKAQSSLRFSNIYGNNMVLQQSPHRSQIWGYATSSGDTITAQLILDSSNQVLEKLQIVTDSSLIWLFQFSPIEAVNDVTYTVTITSSLTSESISLTNILFGDVYVCSGQSNMQFTVDQAFNATEEIAAANNFPNIRVFSVSRVGASTPQLELPSIMQEWSIANKTNIGGGNWSYFSAVCWFFGRDIYEYVGYPIGLIGSSYGGTPIEDWMSDNALAECNDTVTRKRNNRKKNNNNNNDNNENNKVDKVFKMFEMVNNNNEKNKKEKNVNNNNNNNNNNDEKRVLSDFERYEKKLKENGVNNDGEYGGYKIDNVGGLNFTDLWNAMIFPLLFETIKGVIWYQGEADGVFPYASEYTCTFPAMINDWRYQWSTYSDTDDDFPFGFVQLSTWNDGSENVTCNNDYDCTAVATVRYGQTCNYGYVPNPRQPNVYFATAIDLGDPSSPWTDIHPRYKQPVGQRLSTAAKNIIYGESQLYTTGPIADYATSFSVNNTILINFRNVGEKGLYVKNSAGLEVYTTINDTYWMDAPLTSNIKVIGDYNIELILDSSVLSVNNVEYIRYNWYTAPCMPFKGPYLCAIYDMEYELPSTPFFVEVNQVS